MNKKIILITGASEGIGLIAGKLLAGQGHKVYGTSRSENKFNKMIETGINPLQLDVKSDESCKKCIEEIIKKEGKIDVLINNAGFGFYGPIEMVSIEEAKNQLEVNVFGLVRMTKLVIPYMRKEKSGRIINISSVAGRVTTYLGGWYHASKYAVETISDSLRMETKKFGIDVVIIEPGAITSKWGTIAMDNLEKTVEGTEYKEEAAKVIRTYRKMYDPKNKIISKPELVAKKISKAVNVKNPRTRYAFGFGAKILIFLHAILPTRAFDWIMKSMFNIKI